MVTIWTADFFRGAGVTLFYRVPPQEEYDRLLSLTVRPHPEKIVRVGLVQQIPFDATFAGASRVWSSNSTTTTSTSARRPKKSWRSSAQSRSVSSGAQPTVTARDRTTSRRVAGETRRPTARQKLRRMPCENCPVRQRRNAYGRSVAGGAEVPGRPATAPDGWTTAAPRDEIRPEFAYEPKGGPTARAASSSRPTAGEGLDGCWKKTFPVTGGKHYHFQASYQAKGVAVPRRSIVVELHWSDAKGKKVPLDQPPVTGYLRGATAMAETEFPTTRGTDRQGWTEVSDTYQAPSQGDAGDRRAAPALGRRRRGALGRRVA